MFVVLAKMGESPYNRSIWTGFTHAFQHLGWRVQTVEAKHVPDPAKPDEQPDLFFAVHGGHVPVTTVELYREQGILCAVHLLDEPYEVDDTKIWGQHYDWVFSVDRATVPIHAQNTHATHLPLAYDAAVFNTQIKGFPSEILMLGSPYSVREEIMERLRKRWARHTTWVGPGWRKFSQEGQHVDRFVGPADCARFYRGANIVINIHRDSLWSHQGGLNKAQIQATHLNPRFWEASGCGGFQLCSYRSDLEKFSPQTASFKTTDELMQKIEYFMGNPQAREENAKRVYRKIKDHTYIARTRTIIDTIGLGTTS